MIASASMTGWGRADMCGKRSSLPSETLALQEPYILYPQILRSPTHGTLEPWPFEVVPWKPP